MNVKQKIESAKKFVEENKTKILVTTTVVSTTVAVLTQIGRHNIDGFLRENDLYDAYYKPDADE